MLIAAELYWSTIDLSIHICVDSSRTVLEHAYAGIKRPMDHDELGYYAIIILKLGNFEGDIFMNFFFFFFGFSVMHAPAEVVCLSAKINNIINYYEKHP